MRCSSLGTWAPGLFGAVVLLGLSGFVWKTILNHPAIHLQQTSGLASEPVVIDK